MAVLQGRGLPRYLWGFVCCCGVLSLSGCAPTEDTHFERYTLTQSIAPEAYDSPYSVSVKLVPILDQGGVVIQLSDVALRPAKNYRFSAQLATELQLLLIDQLQKQEIDPRYHFAVQVTKFQGTLEGRVIVEAYVQVTDARRNNREVLAQGYVKQSEQRDDGYGSLVTELKSNYLALASQLISDLQAKTSK